MGCQKNAYPFSFVLGAFLGNSPEWFSPSFRLISSTIFCRNSSLPEYQPRRNGFKTSSSISYSDKSRLDTRLASCATVVRRASKVSVTNLEAGCTDMLEMWFSREDSGDERRIAQSAHCWWHLQSRGNCPARRPFSYLRSFAPR